MRSPNGSGDARRTPRTPSAPAGTPSPERARLTAALRDLKERAGLSLTRLEERTPFSKSSWGRYLKGETLPPREAVRELCRLAGEPAARCLALWELAESESSGRAAQARAPAPAAPPEPGPAPPAPPAPAPADPSRPADGPEPRRGPRRIASVIAAVLAVAAAGVTATVLLLPSDRAPDEARAPLTAGTGSGTGTATGTAPPPPRCRGAACEGRDPVNMLCGFPPDTLIEHRTASGAHLQVRYSSECGTSWGRVWGTRVGDRVELTAAGPTRSAEVTDALDAKAYVYTPMTRSRPGTVVRACFRSATAPGRECFEATVR
ncbi:helix-turn-helix domain-containing protein [Streptomyces sp. NPDC057433]|uniref:helix-turn-helix domain-containing protein n=2 Tax=unclassified Streptomyces TaxID=2593676 RepID=UPI0036C995B8